MYPSKDPHPSTSNPNGMDEDFAPTHTVYWIRRLMDRGVPVGAWHPKLFIRRPPVLDFTFADSDEDPDPYEWPLHIS